jgi:predicted ArsR family transcriptional regulator
MSKSTLDAIEELLRSAPEGLSAGEVAERLGIVRVTGRRYLEYLAEHDLTVRSPRYGGPGRPEHVVPERGAQRHGGSGANPSSDELAPRARHRSPVWPPRAARS